MTCSHSHGPRYAKSRDGVGGRVVAWNDLFRGEIEFAVVAKRRHDDRRTVNGCS